MSTGPPRYPGLSKTTSPAEHCDGVRQTHRPFATRAVAAPSQTRHAHVSAQDWGFWFECVTALAETARTKVRICSTPRSGCANLSA